MVMFILYYLYSNTSMIMAIYTGHRIISKNKKTEKESNSIENEE
ncbi:MAG: DUF6219 family protein [Blautia wexlerae]